MVGFSRRSIILGAAAISAAGAGVTTAASGLQGSVEGQADVQASQAIQVADVSVESAGNKNPQIVQSADTTIRVATALSQGDSIQINATLFNRASDPVAARVDVASSKGIISELGVDDSNFDTSKKVTLTVQLQATDLISPGSYTTEIDISPVTNDRQESTEKAKARADVHFLLDNSLSVGNDIDAIKDGINGFFRAVEKTPGGERINLAASVSEFGGEESEIGGDGGPDTRVVQRLTTDSDDVETAIDNLGTLGSFDEDGYIALRRVLDGRAGVRPGGSQIPILFSDELGPNVLDTKPEIEDLQDRVKQEAAGFIGIGDTNTRSGDEPPILLDEFTKNVTEDIDGAFFQSPDLRESPNNQDGSNLLAGEIADTVRLAAAPDARGVVVDGDSFIFKF